MSQDNSFGDGLQFCGGCGCNNACAQIAGFLPDLEGGWLCNECRRIPQEQRKEKLSQFQTDHKFIGSHFDVVGFPHLQPKPPRAHRIDDEILPNNFTVPEQYGDLFTTLLANHGLHFALRSGDWPLVANIQYSCCLQIQRFSSKGHSGFRFKTPQPKNGDVQDRIGAARLVIAQGGLQDEQLVLTKRSPQHSCERCPDSGQSEAFPHSWRYLRVLATQNKDTKGVLYQPFR